MFIRTFFLTTCLLLTAGYSCLRAQQPLVDSIEKVLQQSTLTDSARAKAMVLLAMYAEPVGSAGAHQLYGKARAFAASKKDVYHEALGLRFEATLYKFDRKHDSAVQNLQAAIKLFSTLNATLARYQLGHCSMELGNIFKEEDNYDTAAYHYLNAVAAFEALDKKESLVTAYNNLSSTFKQAGLYEKQNEYADKGLVVAKVVGKPRPLFQGYLFKASYYLSTSNFKAVKAYVDSATPYFTSDIEAELSLAYLYSIMAGVAHQNIQQFDSAFYYYNKSLGYGEKWNAPWYKIEPLTEMANIRIKQKRFGEAEKYIKLALARAQQDSLELFVKKSYYILAMLYHETGKYKEAYDNLDLYYMMQDSIAGEEHQHFVLNLEKKYGTEKKELRIKQLESDQKIQELSLGRKNLLNYILIGSAFILLVIALLSYRNYKQKQALQQQKINELETEKQLTATEAVLKGEDQERTRLAKDLHDGLGGMLSGIKHSFNSIKGNLVMTSENQRAFDRSMDMLDGSIREMRRVAHNMMPEALVKFGLDAALKDFCNDINQSGALAVTYQSIGMENATIDHTTAVTVYRIVQELINNTLKHAGATTAIVQLSKTDDLLAVTVEDNGKGFDPAILVQGKGMGWSNIRSRVDFLKGNMDVQSTSQGTSVLIELGV